MKMLFSGDDEQFQPKSLLYIEVLKKNNADFQSRIDRELFFVRTTYYTATPLFVTLVVY
jgi:hypothetical protein